MDLTAIFTQNPQCPVRSLDDGLIIMSPNGTTTHSLEDLGLFIWNQLDGTRNLQNILDIILEQYEVEEDQAQDDLLKFTAQMQSTNLILET